MIWRQHVSRRCGSQSGAGLLWYYKATPLTDGPHQHSNNNSVVASQLSSSSVVWRVANSIASTSTLTSSHCRGIHLNPVCLTICLSFFCKQASLTQVTRSSYWKSGRVTTAHILSVRQNLSVGWRYVIHSDRWDKLVIIIIIIIDKTDAGRTEH